MAHILQKRVFYFFSSLFLLSLFPASVFASVSISEVMYDPAGSDDGHEWIEIYNSGASLDIAKWKLFEGGSNHGITAYAGGSALASGGYAVLADNPQKFLADWPNFSGQVFDTVFSGGLNNTNGETLTLRDGTGADVDSVTYNPALGGNGDGNSLQKVGTSFTVGSPTPGAPLGGTTTEGGDSTGTDTTTTDTSASQNTPSVATYPVEPQIKVSIGNNRTVVAGADTVFRAEVQGLKGDVISNARMVWNFGNGESSEGASVLYAFPYPGTYVVVLDASSDIHSASARITVTAVPANVAVTEVSSEFIEITNRSSMELNLGLWELSADGVVFRFPANTILSAHESALISNSATALHPSSPSAVSLLYPNGTLAVAYGSDLILAHKKTTGVVPTSVGITENTTSTTRAPSVATVPVENMLAAPIMSFGSSSMPNLLSFGMLPWILGLLVVVGIGIATVLLIKSESGTTTGYTIIEEE